MTYQDDFTLPAELLEQITSEGFVFCLNSSAFWSTLPCKLNGRSIWERDPTNARLNVKVTPMGKSQRRSRPG